MTRRLVPLKETRVELLFVNSRFIASLAPAGSVEEAREFINRMRTEFADASHNVPAFVIGHGESTIAHSNDDGEPSGTAGRPALAVLQGSGLGDAVVVITRYFGGTKLGTGGLVKAYGDSVRAVVEAAPRAEKVPTHTVMLGLPYRLLERVRLLVSEHRGQIIAEDFAADVTITASFPVEALAGFQEALSELSAGSLQAEILDTGEAIVPVRGEPEDD